MTCGDGILDPFSKPPEPEYGSGPAGAYEQREAWLSFVKPAANIGKLEKFPTQRAKTTQERDAARSQNYHLTRVVFGGFHPNYDLIDWSR